MWIIFFQKDNKLKGKWATSCAANPFWMAKPILWKTTSIDLGETTLLCVIFFELFAKDQQHLVLGIQTCQTQMV
jgi:hypothetical protein